MRIPCSPWLAAALVAASASHGLAEAPAAPLSLEEAIATALRHHPQVAAARAMESAATARVGQARSPWLPQVNISAGLRQDYSYQTGLPDCPPEQPGCRQPDLASLRYNASLQLSQLLYDFGRTGGRMDAARAGARAAAGDRETTQAQVVLGAITAYYGVLQAEALLEVAQQNLGQQAQRLRQAERFVTIGTRPEIDALIAHTGHAQAELQVLQARNQVLQARVQLLQAMGVKDQGWLGRPLRAAPATPIGDEGRALEGLLPGALAARPEHRALRERLNQAEAQLRAARGDYFPQLSLTGGAVLSGTYGGLSFGAVGGATRPDLPTAGQPGFALNAALTLSWSPFQGLTTVYAVREAEAQVSLARANLEAFEQQVRSGLQQALFQVQTAEKAVSAAEALRSQAERQLAMAQGRYSAGVGNVIELGDAQLSATQARAQRVQADYNLQLARAALRLQLGQLLDKERRP